MMMMGMMQSLRLGTIMAMDNMARPQMLTFTCPPATTRLRRMWTTVLIVVRWETISVSLDMLPRRSVTVGPPDSLILPSTLSESL